MSSTRPEATRTRQLTSDRLTADAVTSPVSTSATTAHTPSATSTGDPSLAAGGAREEDHALGVARNLVEGAHQFGLPPAVGGDDRNRGPHPEIELGTERRDQLLLLLEDLDITL